MISKSLNVEFSDMCSPLFGSNHVFSTFCDLWVLGCFVPFSSGKPIAPIAPLLEPRPARGVSFLPQGASQLFPLSAAASGSPRHQLWAAGSTKRSGEEREVPPRRGVGDDHQPPLCCFIKKTCRLCSN